MASTFIVSGGVIDQETGEQIPGARVTMGLNSVNTDAKGTYSFNITLEDAEPAPVSLTVTKTGYSPASGIPTVRGDGTLKTKINLVKLDTLSKSLEKETASLKVISEEDVNRLKKFSKKSPEAAVVELLNKEVTNIQDKAIPFALSILASFGITKLDDLPSKTCVPITEMSGIINKKNKLTRQLNNSYKAVNSVTKSGGILTILIKALKIAFRFIKKFPLPVAIGLPPGPAGGLFPGPLTQTLGKVTSFDGKREKIERLLERLENIAGVFTPAIIPLASALSKVLGILRGVDQSVGECLNDTRQAVVDAVNLKNGFESDANSNTINGGVKFETIDTFDFTSLSDGEIKTLLGLNLDLDVNIQDLLSGNYLQQELSKELIALTEEDAEDGQPSVTEYRGFTLAVETESEEKAQGKSIKRRFAVGKNSDGIIIVKGEPSYASSDQVLLDELIFYIETNDLKPN